LRSQQDHQQASKSTPWCTPQVRLWNIPEQHGRVVDYADVHQMVTATIFSADGTRAIVGTMKGKCRFYQCSPDFKLEYQAQIGQQPTICPGGEG